MADSCDPTDELWKREALAASVLERLSPTYAEQDCEMSSYGENIECNGMPQWQISEHGQALIRCSVGVLRASSRIFCLSTWPKNLLAFTKRSNKVAVTAELE
jgi:hypothetical protein